MPMQGPLGHPDNPYWGAGARCGKQGRDTLMHRVLCEVLCEYRISDKCIAKLELGL